MVNMRNYLTAIMTCLSFACGSDDGERREPPSEQVLCSLTVGTSPREEVIAALGPATASTSNGDLSLLHYEYGESEVAVSVADVSSLMIVLDENGVFEDATAINVPFPECWSTQIEARDEARERELAGG